MKAIQIMLDNDTLAALDADEEVRRCGRSAVFRQITRDYLQHRRQRLISRQYRQAYGPQPGLGDEFAGWEREGVWPRE